MRLAKTHIWSYGYRHGEGIFMRLYIYTVRIYIYLYGSGQPYAQSISPGAQLQNYRHPIRKFLLSV